MNSYNKLDEFTILVIKTIKSIPEGKVATYGQIARFCGKPKGARQVSRILHSCSQKYGLPWHRVISSKGIISLPGKHGELQAHLLKNENVELKSNYKIDLKKYQANF
jgi:methylated-DNA-protein-cysteine methyltransferase-like protein